MEEKNTQKKEVAKTLTFQNALCGTITVDRAKLVSSLTEESRSYAAHQCKIDGQNEFTLPEFEALKILPSGFKLDVTVKLKDNLGKNEGSKKGIKSL